MSTNEERKYRRWAGPNYVVTWMSEDRDLNTILLLDLPDVVQITSTMPTTAFTEEELIETVKRLHPGKPVELHPNFNEYQAASKMLDPKPFEELDHGKNGHGSRPKPGFGSTALRTSDDGRG